MHRAKSSARFERHELIAKPARSDRRSGLEPRGSILAAEIRKALGNDFVEIDLVDVRVRARLQVVADDRVGVLEDRCAVADEERIELERPQLPQG